jgi:hypothetical protein
VPPSSRSSSSRREDEGTRFLRCVGKYYKSKMCNILHYSILLITVIYAYLSKLTYSMRIFCTRNRPEVSLTVCTWRCNTTLLRNVGKYQSTRRHFPKDLNVYQHCCVNPKSYREQFLYLKIVILQCSKMQHSTASDINACWTNNNNPCCVPSNKTTYVYICIIQLECHHKAVIGNTQQGSGNKFPTRMCIP